MHDLTYIDSKQVHTQGINYLPLITYPNKLGSYKKRKIVHTNKSCKKGEKK